jgi:hypothetical protein
MRGLLVGLLQILKNQNSMTVEEWILTLTHTQESLSNLPICPYAKQAYLNKRYSIIDTEYDTISLDIEVSDLTKYQVIIFKLKDYQSYDIETLRQKTNNLNNQFNKNDIVVLDNDPRDPFFINDVKTTYDECYLWLIQSLSDLNDKSKELEKINYYKHWTKEQLDDVVNWRKV